MHAYKDAYSLYILICVASVFVGLLSTSGSAAARQLRSGRDWGDIGDPSGYQTMVNARQFDGKGSKVKKAITPEQAESAVSSDWKGIYRYQPSEGSKASFATVESDPVTLNPDRRKEAVRPWGRAAIDSPQRPVVDVESNPQLPALAMGTAAGAQTYEGATAISASDSVEVNGGRQKTTTAKSMLTSGPKPVPRASAGASIGLTAQTVRSVALAGPADGIITLAQAESVAAMSQASRSKADQWQNP